MKKLFYLIIAGVVLAGCATTYQGSYVDMPLGNGRHRIDVRGNGVTGPETLQDIALVRAADLTLSQGKTHFIIMNSDVNSKDEYFESVGTLELEAITRYQASIIIKIIEDGNENGIDAHKIISERGPSVGYSQ